jgi:ATP-dependent DNA ligase
MTNGFDREAEGDLYRWMSGFNGRVEIFQRHRFEIGATPARYFALHLLWLNGQDLRQLPLLRRKEKLKRILPSRSSHVLYVDHSRGNGTALYTRRQSV